MQSGFNGGPMILWGPSRFSEKSACRQGAVQMPVYALSHDHMAPS